MSSSCTPYGYRTVEAGQKGRRTKKILAIDPVEAEAVRLMYRLIVDGDGQSGPMGVKSVCTWLNARDPHAQALPLGDRAAARHPDAAALCRDLPVQPA